MERTETTRKIYNEYCSVFTGIGCFKGTFSLQFKENMKPYQVLSMYIAYAPKNHSKRARKTTKKQNPGTTGSK